MAFPEAVATEALVRSGRCCCLCHKFCAVKIELHHILPAANGGADTFENCIPLCFDCHAEIGHYNPEHPRGRRFRPEELRKHRDRWYGLWSAIPKTMDLSGTYPGADIVRAEMRRIGGGVNHGKENWLWAVWAEVYINVSLPSISIPLHRCRVELRLLGRKRAMVGYEMGIDATSGAGKSLDPIKIISGSLSGPGQVVIREPDFVRLAALFETPVWKRRSSERAEARFRLAVAQLAFAEIEVTVPLEATPDEGRWRLTKVSVA